MPGQEFPGLQIQPVVFQPLPNPKKKKLEQCPVCSRRHENPGYYLCLGCGMFVCSDMALGHSNGDALLSHITQTSRKYGERTIGYSSVGSCGPAIRIVPPQFTIAILRKVVP